MTPSDLERELDNPVWSCLTTRHGKLASGGPLARRYLPAYSPIAAVSGIGRAHVAALEALVEIGDDIGVIGPLVPALGTNWETLRDTRLAQMIRTDRSPLPEGGIDASPLGPADVAEMLALIDLTQPGPFRTRTIELGTYLGVREGGRLVAMAGERMWVGNFREVSAVCTHPDVRGRGYARALMGVLINRMLRADQIPFLHVEYGNERAIETYHALAFVRRAELPLLYARRCA